MKRKGYSVPPGGCLRGGFYAIIRHQREDTRRRMFLNLQQYLRFTNTN